VTPNPDFNGTKLFAVEYVRNKTRSTVFAEFTDATNDTAADSISEHRLTPTELTIRSNTNIILFPVPGVSVYAV